LHEQVKTSATDNPLTTLPVQPINPQQITTNPLDQSQTAAKTAEESKIEKKDDLDEKIEQLVN